MTKKTTTKGKASDKNAAAQDGEKKQLSDEQIAAITAAPEDADPSLGPKPSKDRAAITEAEGPEVESVRVLIKRNELTTVPKRVFSHEVVILQAIHGEENIEVVEGSEVQLPLIGDAQQELDRLVRVYGRKQQQIVLAQYGNARQLADELGIDAPRVRRATKRGAPSGKASSHRGRGVE